MGTAYNTNVVSDGLIGCWDAGNRRSYPGAGTTWTDLGGSSNGSFENSGGTSLAFDSAHGGSIVFDGTDDYVLATDFQNVSPVSGTNSYTFGIWVYFDSVEATTFLSQYISASNRWSFWVNASNDIYFADRGSGGDVQSTGYSYTFTTTQWYYLTVLRDGSTLKIYIDGSLADSQSFNPNNPARSAGLLFGTDTDNYDTLDGKIALVHAYNKALTDAEVLQNYEATKSRFLPRITKRGMNLNFDAGDPASYPGGTTWKDTANGLTTAPFTDHNMSASNFNSSNGGYFDFDGTDEYMSVVNSPLFQGAIADQGTFAAWFNIDAAETLSRDAPIWGAGANGSDMTWSMAQYHSSKKMHLGTKHGGSWAVVGDTDTALSYDTWYYVVFTWDKANTQVKSYVNGALDDTDSTSSASITTSSTGWLGIGASLYSTSNGSTPFAHLNGFIGVLQLYDSVLSAAEIMDNYQKTKARFGH